MLFNIDKISDKFDSLTDFIPLYKFQSETIKDVEHTMYINKNKIYAFSYFKKNEKECLLVKFDINKNIFPTEYVICKEDNPVAFNELFKGAPEKLSKYNNTTA
jgi:hypothetical protein